MLRRAVVSLSCAVLLLSACSSSGNDHPQQGGQTGGSASSDPSASQDPPGGSHKTKAERVLADVMAGKGDFVVVSTDRYLPMWEKLGSKDPSFVFDTHNPDGGHSPMLIDDAKAKGKDAWLQVLLPIRPNGSAAWVSTDDVRIQERRDRLEVDLSKRTLEHFRDGELVDRFKVGVGQPQYPTGTGTFYVWVKVPFENPNQPYGVYALGLSGFSPVLSDWPGEGRMAVHGTPYSSNRGQAVSHGCVRVYNPDMETLKDLPLGTPVIISD